MNEDVTKDSSIGVIGAGIQGICISMKGKHLLRQQK